MTELINRTKLMIIYTVIILSLLAYFGILSPMKEQLRHSTLENFVQLASSKYQTLENTINRSIEGAKSVSSRTMIKNKITEYLRHDVTINELKNYTQPKYEAGAKVLHHLMVAERLVNRQNIARYENPRYSTYPSCNLDQQIDNLSMYIERFQEKTILRVISPIIDRKEVVGYDCLAFDLSRQISLLCDDHCEAYIIFADQYDNIKKNMDLFETRDTIHLFRDEKSIYAIIEVQDSTAFVVKAQKNDLFGTVNDLVRRSVIIWFGVFVALMLVIYMYIIRFATKKIKQIEISRDKFKGLAYKDKMTNTYSRIFLEVWNNTLRPNFAYYTVVMIDIDHFKAVNDKYGHLVGDDVIKEVSKSLMASVRQGDYVVRYGGDEFVLLLENIKEKNAMRIMNRVISNIGNIKSFGFDVSISYGVSSVNAADDFYEKLRLADDRMYINKRKKSNR